VFNGKNNQLETATRCCPSGQASGSAVEAGDLSGAKISIGRTSNTAL